jgi:hypothetical protein
VQPYIVKQGDYLALIAYRLGFDADTVWNDPSNAALRAQRPDPNVLFPGDVLSVPTPAPSTGAALETGQTNSFTVNPPTVTVTLKFVDAELASQPVTIFELPALTGLVTGGDGTLTLTVPITQQTCTVVFSSDGTTFTCNVGDMNPLGTVSGVAQRLQNLGYLDPYSFYGSDDIETVRAALRAFRADQPASSSPSASTPPPSSPSSGDASGPPSSDAPREVGMPEPPGSDPSPPSTPPASAPASQPPASQSPASQPPASQPPASQPPASQPPASSPPASAPPPSGSAPPPSAPASSPPPSSGSAPASSPPSSQGGTDAEDDAGLADDGTLDPAVAQLLLSVHGS